MRLMVEGYPINSSVPKTDLTHCHYLVILGFIGFTQKQLPSTRSHEIHNFGEELQEHHNLVFR